MAKCVQRVVPNNVPMLPLDVASILVDHVYCRQCWSTPWNNISTDTWCMDTLAEYRLTLGQYTADIIG